MVSCKLYGRLGNQMFQIAAVVGYAVKHKMDYSIPDKTIDPKVWPAYFEGMLEYKPLLNGMYSYYQEPSHAYEEIPSLTNIMLDGYFQSYKYFDFCESMIAGAFGFDWEMQKGRVGVHVRRGDYLNYPDKHPVVKVEYLFEAIMRMAKNGYSDFMFFSDDIPWCKLMPKPIMPWMNYSYSEGSTEMQDMMEMSCCEHNIISNSSFSWWAAMLNRNLYKIVITPDESNWFGPANKHLDVSTLIPPNWQRIKY